MSVLHVRHGPRGHAWTCGRQTPSRPPPGPLPVGQLRGAVTTRWTWVRHWGLAPGPQSSGAGSPCWGEMGEPTIRPPPRAPGRDAVDRAWTGIREPSWRRRWQDKAGLGHGALSPCPASLPERGAEPCDPPSPHLWRRAAHAQRSPREKLRGRRPIRAARPGPGARPLPALLPG